MHTHHGHGSTTVIETERDSSTLIVGVIIALLVLFVIWLFAFSGWIGSVQQPSQTNIQEREGDTEINVPPGGGTQREPTPPASPYMSP